MTLKLFNDMVFIAIAVYLAGKSSRVLQYIKNPYSWGGTLWLTVFFSSIAMFSIYGSIPLPYGALANTSISGVLLSGFVGGPLVGGLVGVVSGLYRYSLGGITATASALAGVLVGLLAGLVRQRVGLYNLNWKIVIGAAFLAEIIRKSLDLLLVKPFAYVWEVETIIGFPILLITVLGALIFLQIINLLRDEQDWYKARAAQLALAVATQTLPYLRQGLKKDSAQKTAEIIHRLVDVDSVSIADREKILGFAGKGGDHHKTGERLLPATAEYIEKGHLGVVEATAHGCQRANCPLKAWVVAPLEINGTVVGSINLYRSERGGISETDTRIAEGLARLLSMQIQLAEIDEQRKIREQAELRALQAQINPHFLFNTLSIIMHFCRTAPETARDLLEQLTVLLERGFAHRQEVIPLEEEMAGVEAYLSIAQARFGGRLRINMYVEKKARRLGIPALSIQPLVENAILHGLFPKLHDCQLCVRVQCRAGEALITISDNGVGIADGRLADLLKGQENHIGMANVNNRLISLYGQEYGLKVVSALGMGTTVNMRIPKKQKMDVAV